MFINIAILMTCAVAPPPAATAPAAADHRAAAWLQEADRRAAAMPAGEHRDWLLGRLAKLHARVRDVDGVLTTTAVIEKANLRIYALSGALRNLIAAGDLAGARRVLDALRDFASSPAGRESYHFTDGHVIEAFVALDDVAGAIRFIRNNHEQHAQGSGFERLATELAKRGDVERAVTVVEHSQVDAWRPRSRLVLVRALAELRRFDRAAAVARLIDPGDKREDALVSIIRARAAAGEPDEARRMAADLTIDARRDQARRAIDEARARSVDVGEGSRTSSGLIYVAGLFPTDCAEVGELIGRGDLRGAEARVGEAVRRVDGEHHEPVVSKFGTFTDASRRAAVRLMYLDVALAHARAQDAQAYARCIEQARRGVGIMDMEFYRELMLAEIAGAQLAAGRSDDARATALQIATPEARDGPLMQLARVQTQSGDLDGARRTAEAISPRFRAGVRGEIIRARQERGAAPAEVLADAREIAAMGAEAGESLEWIATLLKRTVDDAAFAAWLDALPSPAMKAHASVGAAAAYLPDEQPPATRPVERGNE